jgi:signal transduction histidine kinase
VSRISLKRLLALNIGIVVGAIVLLVGGWLYSLSSLQHIKSQLFKDAANLHVAQQMESASALAYEHHRLWRITGQAPEREAAAQQWKRTAELARSLPENITTAQERILVREVETRLQQLTQTIALQQSARPHNGQVQSATAALRDAVREHRAINQVQMNRMALAGNRIEGQTRFASLLLIVAALAAIAWGSFNLWSRIFRPILALSQSAAAFGAGDSQARTLILWDDEMGQLGRTFNDMAQSIAEREKERLDFVATVAHDLKSPLVVVGGAAELLEKGAASAAEQKRWLQTIRRNARVLERIIADLTDRVQAQTGRLQLHREVFDLAAMSAEIVAQYNDGGQEKRLNFASASPALVNGDRARLERVLHNLLSNACKYSAPDSAVQVTIEARDGVVMLRVDDEGIGIAPEDIVQVFQPFSRLEQARAMAAGSGLGLSSARKIIEAHGGIIRLMSQPQHGTTVEVRLPQASHGA